jgi:DNA polymerase-3 subunit gamma/tau
LPKQALYLAWRPTTFADVIGQDHITRTLRNALKAGRVRHAYLFSGPRGTGKTTMARLLAKAVNCQDEDADVRPCNHCAACVAVNQGRYLDLIEIDAATHTGVDDVRDLRDKIAFAPGEGRFKVYIIDEVHRFSGSAFDALLKTLEEPPEHAIFVLATTEIDRVPPTIKSRCLLFEFRRVALQSVADRLGQIAAAEGLQVERGALELIARQGTGSVRDSISLLDQIVTDPDETITLELAQRVLGTASISAVKDVVGAIIAGDAAGGLRVINDAIDSGSDPLQFGSQVVEHLRAILLAQTAGPDLVEAASEDRALYAQQAEQIARPALLRALRAFNEAVNDYKGGWQPQLALELALMESVHGPAEPIPAPAPAAQTAQPTAAPATPAPQPQAAEDAVVAPGDIQGKWVEIQQEAHKLDKFVPALLQHFQVHSIESNLVTLSTHNAIFRDKLDTGDKRQILEKALYQVMKTPLRVRVVLQQAPASPVAEVDLDDPVIAAGLELGGELGQLDDDERRS